MVQWEIWQVVWEHEDGTAKDRPALIISPTAANTASESVWVAKISSQPHEVPHRIHLDKTAPSFAATGLRDSCYLYLSNVRKIRKFQMIRRRGCLPSFNAAMIAIELKKAIRNYSELQ